MDDDGVEGPGVGPEEAEPGDGPEPEIEQQDGTLPQLHHQTPHNMRH